MVFTRNSGENTMSLHSEVLMVLKCNDLESLNRIEKSIKVCLSALKTLSVEGLKKMDFCACRQFFLY